MMHRDDAVPTADHWLAALRDGTVLATCCPRCGRVWLPPRPICPNDHAPLEWVPLSGEGIIEDIVRVRGLETDASWHCARVRMDGATTRLVGRLDTGAPASAAIGTRVRVVASPAPVSHRSAAEQQVSDAPAWVFVPTEG